jgi:hypothetical protein
MKKIILKNIILAKTKIIKIKQITKKILKKVKKKYIK